MKAFRPFRKFPKMIFAVVALAALAPSPLLACAACYGRSSSPLAVGMNWGIFTLMAVIVTVLTTIGGFFIYLVRRQIAFEKMTLESNLSEVKV